MTATICIAYGCHFCEDLKSRLTQAKIPYNVSYTRSCGSATPGTILSDGSCHGYGAGAGSCDVDCQYTLIANEHNAPTASPKQAIITPVAPATAPVATTVAKPYDTSKPSVWASEELTIKWGGLSSTAAKSYPDTSEEAVSPTPPGTPVGMTIALKEHKKDTVNTVTKN